MPGKCFQQNHIWSSKETLWDSAYHNNGGGILSIGAHAHNLLDDMQYIKAIDLYTKALEVRPLSATFLSQLVLAFRSQGRCDLAMEKIDTYLVNAYNISVHRVDELASKQSASEAALKRSGADVMVGGTIRTLISHNIWQDERTMELIDCWVISRSFTTGGFMRYILSIWILSILPSCRR